MTVSIGVSSKAFGNLGGTTAGVTTQASGSTFYLGVILGQGAVTPAPTSITDSYSNTYTQIGAAVFDTVGRAVYEYQCQNGAGGAGHTATVVSANSATLFFGEAIGCVTSGGYDQRNTGSTNFAASIGTGSISLAPAASGEAIFSLFSSAVFPTSAPAVSGAFTTFVQSYTDSTTQVAGALAAAVVSSTTTYSATWSDGNGSSDLIATLNAFQGASGVVVTPALSLLGVG